MPATTSAGLSLSLGRMSLYEEYITGLICYRNELEALVESWPRGGGCYPFPTSASHHQDTERLTARLHAVMRHFKDSSQRWSEKRAVDWMTGLDEGPVERPAGLPAMPADGKVEETLLDQVEQLIDELSDLGLTARSYRSEQSR